MSMTSWAHLTGRVTSVESSELPDGRTRYAIRIGEKNWKRPKREKYELDEGAEEIDTVDVIAYGDEHYDPWAELEKGDECAVDGELCVDPEDGKTGFVARFVRAAYFSKEKLSGRDWKQAEKHAPGDEN